MSINNLGINKVTLQSSLYLVIECLVLTPNGFPPLSLLKEGTNQNIITSTHLELQLPYVQVLFNSLPFNWNINRCFSAFALTR